jgi:hypothetical protein
LNETFDRIGLWLARPCINCSVDYTITANTEYFDEFEAIIVDKCTKGRGSWSVDF